GHVDAVIGTRQAWLCTRGGGCVAVDRSTPANGRHHQHCAAAEDGRFDGARGLIDRTGASIDSATTCKVVREATCTPSCLPEEHECPLRASGADRRRRAVRIIS